MEKASVLITRTGRILRGLHGQLLLVLVMVTVLLASPEASAQAAQAQGATWTTREFVWEGDQYRECGFSCLYKKGNEVLATEALFVVKQIDRIENAPSLGVAVRNNLGDFCMGGESPQDCFKRYKRFQVIRLRQIRNSMLNNTDMAASLADDGATAAAGGQGAAAQPVSFSLPANRNPALLQPQTPYIPTFEDIQAQYQLELTRLRFLGDQKYLEWVQSIPPEPSRDDFVKYELVPVNPDRPNGPMRAAIDRSCGQEICYDDAAYTAAMNDWQAVLNQHRQDLIRMQAHRPAVDRGTQIDAQTVGRETHEAFIEARGMIIDSVNAAIGGNAGSPALNFGPAASGRQVASTGGTGGQAASAGGSGGQAGGQSGASSPSAPRYTGREAVMQVPSGEGVKDTFATPVLPGLDAAIESISIR